MSDFLEVTCVLLCSFAVLLVVVIAPAHFIDKAGCEGYASTLGMESKYSFSTGCILNTPQGWVGKGQYIIVRDEAK